MSELQRNLGTGHGYAFALLSTLNHVVNIRVIIAGGSGNWRHLLEGLKHDQSDAVATANLLEVLGCQTTLI